jgi:hypothetical protein
MVRQFDYGKDEPSQERNQVVPAKAKKQGHSGGFEAGKANRQKAAQTIQ